VINDDFESVNKLEEIKKEIEQLDTDLEVYLGVTIDMENSKNISDLKNIISKVREKALIVTVAGGNYNINRTACEDSRVDVLTHPGLGRTEGGLDEPILKAANVNDVTIEINFREILNSFRKPRSYILNHIASNIRLCDHFRVQMVVSSSAKSIWEMRPPREMVSMANSLGLDLGKAFAAVTSLPQEIIEKNKKTLEGDRITKGVEIVE
jgi:ribonuclease P/MRP protein subunit RPP1